MTRALIALAITGPTEGIVARRGPSSLALFSLRSVLSSAAILELSVSIYRTKTIRGCARCHGQSLIALVSDDRHQLGQPEQAAFRDDAELAQVSAHGFDELRALADQLRAHTVQHR